MQHIDTKVDVSPSLAFTEGGSVALSIFVPSHFPLESQVDLLFCIHGGSYARRYWNLEFPGFSGYSFAEHMTRSGFVVAAIDMLGMGESGRSPNPEYLERRTMAGAAAEVLAAIMRNLTDGSWARAKTVESTGVGHSLGGMMVITQQALFGSFDRLVVLGWSNKAPALEPAVRQRLLDRCTSDGYYSHEPSIMRRFFYGDDVPNAIIQADERLAVDTSSTLIRDSLAEGLMEHAAMHVRCPVFLGQAEVDTSAEPHHEPGYYTGSSDVTLAIVPGRAHCHNLADQRHTLWNRIIKWVRSV